MKNIVQFVEVPRLRSGDFSRVLDALCGGVDDPPGVAGVSPGEELVGGEHRVGVFPFGDRAAVDAEDLGYLDLGEAGAASGDEEPFWEW